MVFLPRFRVLFCRFLWMSVLVVASVLGGFVGVLAARFLVDLQVDDGGDWSKGSVVLVAAISEAGGVFMEERFRFSGGLGWHYGSDGSTSGVDGACANLG